jgi:exopolysaccharide biosynthesis protein
VIAALLTLLAVSGGVPWNTVGPGVWQREVSMSGSGPLAVVKVVVLRLDPARVRIALDTATREFGLRGAWTIDSAPPEALAAFNAGQFVGGIPWGWLVQDGREIQPPGIGTLGMAFVLDSNGAVSFATQRELSAVRGRARLAFQSYPALLTEDGREPWELQAPGRGVSLTHRDSRLALGLLADGSVIVALTRFTGLGKAGERMPWGPTVPEMAAFMRSLGCVRAMLLDGGISSQLVVRGADGELQRWPNWRAVPLALVISER